jgi:mannosyltransferase
MPLFVENDAPAPAPTTGDRVGRAAATPAPPAPSAPSGFAWPSALIPGAALAVFAWGLTGPGPWRDEVVTVEVSTRPWTGILAVVREVDLVHAAYYALVHLVAGALPGVAPLVAARGISAVAMATTVWALIRLTARLARLGPARPRSVVVASAAGAILALSAGASRYAQEARPFALATALATCATLALATAMTDTEGTEAIAETDETGLEHGDGHRQAGP